MSYLKEIKRHTGPNMAGIVELKLVRSDNVVTVPTAIDGVIYDSVEFLEGFGFVSWATTSQSVGIKSRHMSDLEGTSKRSSLPFSLPKDNPGVAQQLERAIDDEFIVLFRDANGNLKIFGTKENPVRFKFDYDTGKAHRGKNGYDCEFYYDGNHNVYFYEGDVPVAPITVPPVRIEWNDGETVTTILVAQPGDVVRFNSNFAYTDFEINPQTI